jgi:hypothetical protein
VSRPRGAAKMVTFDEIFVKFALDISRKYGKNSEILKIEVARRMWNL